MIDPVFLKEWSEDTDISWALEGRKKLNVIIREYNAWQREAIETDYYTSKGAQHLRALIEEARQTWASQDGGSGWLADLEKMAAIIAHIFDGSRLDVEKV